MKLSFNKNKFLLLCSCLLIIVTILLIYWGIYSKQYYVIPMSLFSLFAQIPNIINLIKKLNKDN